MLLQEKPIPLLVPQFIIIALLSQVVLTLLLSITYYKQLLKKNNEC